MLDPDDGLTMNLGVNPLLQFGLEETRRQLCENILADLSVVNYVQFIPIGVYTIMEVRSGKGSSAGWGRLKSGIGWISLDFVRRI